jgi:glutamate mutase epsilon subunit
MGMIKVIEITAPSLEVAIERLHAKVADRTRSSGRSYQATFKTVMIENRGFYDGPYTVVFVFEVEARDWEDGDEL